MTASTLAILGTAAAVIAAGLLLWSSIASGREMHAGFEAAKERDTAATDDRAAIRTEMQDGFSAIRTEMQGGFSAVLERLPPPTDAADENTAERGEQGASGPAEAAKSRFPPAATVTGYVPATTSPTRRVTP